MPADDATPDTGEETTPNDDTPDPGVDLRAEVEKWKRLARHHEARSKANKAEIDRLRAETDGANRSDMEKLQATVDQLRTELAEERRKAMVAEIASEKGLTPAQAKRLQGTTREELEADADEIVEAFGIKRPAKGDEAGSAGEGKGDKPEDTSGDGQGGDKPVGLGRPTENLRPGAAGGTAADEFNPDAIAEKVLQRPF